MNKLSWIHVAGIIVAIALFVFAKSMLNIFLLVFTFAVFIMEINKSKKNSLILFGSGAAFLTIFLFPKINILILIGLVLYLVSKVIKK